ncbi:MAG: excinuclease ABC subunit UvrC [Spirochaetaceae bacterium]|nr:excinuclease ABC subunit UvrC [Spirochaetaceae bacterium]
MRSEDGASGPARARPPKESLAEQAERLPTAPGVYLFKSARDSVLYVGKAQSLRSRVRQYVSGGDGRIRIPALVERAVSVEVLVTGNVKEALLLENELIKQHRPPFNVRLRDDKQYLALRIDEQEAWPRVTMVRRFRKDGAQYFGPYTSSVALKSALSKLRRLFPLRSCTEGTFKDYARRGRPCIEYEMKRCLGPCVGLAEPEAYAEQVRGTILFLRGKSKELVEDIEREMAEAAAEERFEDAARLRDRLQAVERTIESQQIVTEKGLDRDVFAIAREGGEVDVQVLHVREGRVIGARDFPFSDVRLDDDEVMASFLGQFYGSGEGHAPPREVLVSVDFEDDGALEALWRERFDQPVTIRRPQRGGTRRLVEIAERNAALALSTRLAARDSVATALDELEERCHLGVRPHRIECYDVSNLQGTLAVASRVVFEDGEPVKKDYRRYRIKQAEAGDDYGCLREVLDRRLARVEREPLPDLLMVDGGRGQLGVVSAALADAGLEVETLGISKERDEDSRSLRVKRGGGLKAERVFRPNRTNPIQLAPSSRGMLLLQRIRDESHRFAIEFQRELRSKVNLTSILEELPGIGPGKRRALLKTLGSLRAVRAASVEQLAAVPGLSQRDAESIRRFFDALAAEAGPEAPGGDGALDAAPAAPGDRTDPEAAPAAPGDRTDPEAAPAAPGDRTDPEAAPAAPGDRTDPEAAPAAPGEETPSEVEAAPDAAREPG